MFRFTVNFCWALAAMASIWTLQVNAQNVFPANLSSEDLSINEMSDLRAKAESDYSLGNYREALERYQRLLAHGVVESDQHAKVLAEDLAQTIICFSNLGEQQQFNVFIEEIIQRYQNQWRLLFQAAAAYNSIEKSGSLIGGEFQRGNYNGDGDYVTAYQRDRVRALQLYLQAWTLLEQESESRRIDNGQIDNNSSDLYRLLMGFANTVKQNDYGQSWRLQILTNLSTLPDYEQGYYYQNRLGAPVDAEGEILVYQVPVNLDAAINDGERWRYILQEISQLNEDAAQWCRWAWADFLWQQYGVQTMASEIRAAEIMVDRVNGFSQRDDQQSAETEKSIYALHSLADDETIAKLATGIRRFVFPQDYNFIARFVQLAQSPVYKISALERLANIYENRRQLPTAADYWRQAIAASNQQRIHYQQRTRYQQRLAQVVGAWAQFEPLAAQAQNSQQKQVGLRFRNATSVKLTAHQIDSERFLRDIKTHLSSNPVNIEWQKINIAEIGRQLLDSSSVYRGRVLKSWTQSLQPLPDHLDKHISIDLPADLRGAYLLKAEAAGGNTNYIVVWNSEAIIIKKPMADGVFYFVADAVTGKPLPNHELQFLGYQQQWREIDRDGNSRRQRETDVLTREFAVHTDRQGQVIVAKEQAAEQYQWLVHTNADDNEFAFLGFNPIWYDSYGYWQEQQTKAYIVSNQPAYRPGQTVELGAWVQTASYREDKIGNHGEQPFFFRIYNPKGEKIAEQRVLSDKFGGISHSIELAEDATLGVYAVEVVGIESRGQFRVEEYKKPEYEVSIETPDQPAPLGEKIHARVQANYYFGAPVSEGKVKIKIERFDHNSQWYPVNEWDWLYGNGYWWFASDLSWYPDSHRWGMRAPPYPWLGPVYGGPPELVQETEVEIGSDGGADIIIDTQAAKLLHGDKDHRYHISVEVIDNSRRSVYGSGEVLVSRQPFQVFAWVDKGYYQTGDTVAAQFQAQSIDQKPIQGSGTAELYRLRYDQNGEVQETLVEQWPLDNQANGRATLNLHANRAGQHRIVYRLEDDKGNIQEGAYLFNVVPTNSIVDGESYHFNDLELIADRAHYTPGDKLQLMINSNHGDAHVLLFERPVGSYTKPLNITLEGKSKVHNIAIGNEDHPNIFVEALTIHNGEVFSVIKEIAVPPEQAIVNVDIDSDQNEYKPGDLAELNLTLTDKDGKPFVGSTIVAVYDKALDYIAGGVKPPPIREYFWQWKRYHQPSLDNSTQLSFYPLVKDADQAMRIIGAFGDRLRDQVGFANANGGELEEMVVTGSMLGSRSEDKSMAFADAEVAAPAPMVAKLSAVSAEPVPDLVVRSDFADSAYWLSPVISDNNGKARVNFTMPDNLTTWLTSVWAMGEQAQVGQASIELITTKKLLLRLQAPRFFIEKDEVVLSANVHNYLDSTEEIKVSLQLDGKEIELMAAKDASQTISIAANGEQRVDWRVKVKQEGLATIRMVAMSQSTRDESDAVEMDFPVYVHGQLVTQSFSGALNREQNQGVITFTVPEQRRQEQSRLELRYSPTLAGAMVDALPYLVDYPYGCTEQTLSRFLPTVLVQNVLKATNIDLNAVKNKQSNLNTQEIGDDKQRASQWRHDNRNPVFDEAEVDRMSRSGLNRLNNMQLTDGGWGWFSGWGEHSSPHTSAYVVHGMQIAKRVGLAIDESRLQRGIDWLRHYQAQELQKLNNAPSKTRPYKTAADNIDAFIAMVLNDAGSSSPAMLDALYRDRLQLSVYAQSMLALTLDASDRTQQRDVVRRNIEQYLVNDDENQTAYLKLQNISSWWYWYGSEYEAQAYYLKLLTKLEPDGEIAPRLVKYLLNNRKHASYWNSTRDTAIVIEAMAEYLIASGETSVDLSLDIKLDGRTVKTVELNRENLFNFDNKLVIEGLDLSAGDHRLEIVKRGNGPLYYNAYVDNFSLEDHIEKQGLELKVERRYYKLTQVEANADVAGSSGQALKQKMEKYQRTAIDENTALDSGDLIEIELVIDSKNDYEYILIEDMKAAGFEPMEVSSGYNGNQLGAYVEFRDNRVAFFVQRLARGKHNLSYRMKAEIPGKFSALPTKVEAMYAPELKANSAEAKVVINN